MVSAKVMNGTYGLTIKVGVLPLKRWNGSLRRLSALTARARGMADLALV